MLTRRLCTERRVTAMESARNALPPKRSVSCLLRRAASVGGGGVVGVDGALNQEKGLKDMADWSVVFVSWEED